MGKRDEGGSRDKPEKAKKEKDHKDDRRRKGENDGRESQPTKSLARTGREKEGSRGDDAAEQPTTAKESRAAADASADRPRSPAPQPAAAPRVQESNGEVSMSIDETNRMRISLGLKPLQLENKAAAKQREEVERHAKKLEDEQKAAKAEVLAERLQQAKEKRKVEALDRKTKLLSDAGEDVDNLSAWVNRSRQSEAERKAAERAKAERLAQQLAQQEEEDEEDSDDEELIKSAEELAGMRVRHGAEELNEGETMILTLADRSILDSKGEIDNEAEELENALMAEQKARAKARKAATKTNKPLFEEDGKVRGLLDKYDEEETDAGMTIDEAGRLDDIRLRRQSEIQAKLAAAAQSVAVERQTGYGASDFYTKEEAAQFMRPKTRKKKKLRKKAVDEDMEDAGLDLAALEAEAAAADQGADRGSRKTRADREAEAASAREAEEERRRERYQNALEKANYASLALRPSGAEEAQGNDEEDDELERSLARARRAAQRNVAPGPDSDDFIHAAARRREEAEREAAAGGLEFTEAAEFARGIQLIQPEDKVKQEEGGHMGIEEPSNTSAPAAPSGDWTASENDVPMREPEIADEDMLEAGGVPVKDEESDEDDDEDAGIVRERGIGKGLAGALSLLQNRGELKKDVEWSGRSNDMKPNALRGLDEVYKGGRHDRRLAEKIESALTQRDEYGRVMTPKERFRQLAYQFHGIPPSKNTLEKRQRKARQEMEQKRGAASEANNSAVERLRVAQRASATPYLVLSGNVKPGQSSDPASAYATVDKRAEIALTPVLGGGTTPLIGDRKVEAMLGLKRPSEGQPGMLPPPPRRPKT